MRIKPVAARGALSCPTMELIALQSAKGLASLEKPHSRAGGGEARRGAGAES